MKLEKFKRIVSDIFNAIFILFPIVWLVDCGTGGLKWFRRGNYLEFASNFIASFILCAVAMCFTLAIGGYEIRRESEVSLKVKILVMLFEVVAFSFLTAGIIAGYEK